MKGDEAIHSFKLLRYRYLFRDFWIPNRHLEKRCVGDRKPVRPCPCITFEEHKIMPSGCFEVMLQIGFIHARIYRKHRIQRGHDTCSVQAVSVDWATRCRHRNSWVVDEVVWLNYIVTTDISIVCDVVVEVVELTNNALLSRICKRLRKGAVNVLGGFLLAELSQLTLFPSGCIINAFILRFESVGCDDVLRSD